MQIRAFCTTGDIHNHNLQGGGAQFNDSIKYYMQGILIINCDKTKNEHRCSTTYYEVKHIVRNCAATTCDALSLFSRRTFMKCQQTEK